MDLLISSLVDNSVRALTKTEELQDEVELLHNLILDTMATDNDHTLNRSFKYEDFLNKKRVLIGNCMLEKELVKNFLGYCYTLAVSQSERNIGILNTESHFIPNGPDADIPIDAAIRMRPDLKFYKIDVQTVPDSAIANCDVTLITDEISDLSPSDIIRSNCGVMDFNLDKVIPMILYLEQELSRQMDEDVTGSVDSINVNLMDVDTENVIDNVMTKLDTPFDEIKQVLSGIQDYMNIITKFLTFTDINLKSLEECLTVSSTPRYTF